MQHKEILKRSSRLKLEDLTGQVIRSHQVADAIKGQVSEAMEHGLTRVRRALLQTRLKPLILGDAPRGDCQAMKGRGDGGVSFSLHREVVLEWARKIRRFFVYLESCQ
jgi:hypothetical protein